MNNETNLTADQDNNQKLFSCPSTIPFPIPSSDDNDPKVKVQIYPPSTLSQTIKEQLQTKVTHYALIIPARLTANLRQSLTSLLINRPRLKDVYPLLEPDDIIEGVNPKSERKIVFANTVINNNDDDDTNDKGESIYSHNLVKALLDNEENNDLYKHIRKAKHEVIIGYDHYTVEQVLSKLLPPSLCKEIPSSFEVIGNIAHLNLRDEYLAFKYIIGRVILDKNKSIQVCVNKIGTIQNEFRTFPMEIIADDRKGNCKSKQQKNNQNDNNSNDNDPLLEVELKEDGCNFKLDFEKVYWNSRLQHEHRRIIHLISGKARPNNLKQRKLNHHKNNPTNSNHNNHNEKEVIVADSCAGIGPFAIPLTSQYSHVKVYANDLNPISFQYLNINLQLNKCQNLNTYNMDARYFIRKLDNEGIRYEHVLMNLPAIAPEFLDVFRGWKKIDDDHQRPWIHVHCFGGKDDEGNEEAIARCSRSLGCSLDKVNDEVSVYIVRDVSPKKNMLCVSFRLPEGVKDLERKNEFGSVTCVYDEDEEDNEIYNTNVEEPNKKRAKVGI